MAKIDNDYVLINSPLSGEYKQDGIMVEVFIYRGEEDEFWILEVVDQANTSYVWDEQFATDELAMKEFLASVRKDGMKQYNPYYNSKFH